MRGLRRPGRGRRRRAAPTGRGDRARSRCYVPGRPRAPPGTRRAALWDRAPAPIQSVGVGMALFRLQQALAAGRRDHARQIGGFLGARPSSSRSDAEVSRLAAENSGAARHLGFDDQPRLRHLLQRGVQDAWPQMQPATGPLEDIVGDLPARASARRQSTAESGTSAAAARSGRRPWVEVYLREYRLRKIDASVGNARRAFWRAPPERSGASGSPRATACRGSGGGNPPNHL